MTATAEVLPTYLTVAEAARVARISSRTMYNLVSAGTVPSVRLSPKTIRIPTRALLLALSGEPKGPAA